MTYNPYNPLFNPSLSLCLPEIGPAFTAVRALAFVAFLTDTWFLVETAAKSKSYYEEAAASVATEVRYKAGGRFNGCILGKRFIGTVHREI